MKMPEDVHEITFSPDGKLMAINFWSTVGIIEVETGKMQCKLTRPIYGEHDWVNFISLAFSPDGQWLAAGEVDFNVTLWRMSDGKQLRVLHMHGDCISAIAFSPDSRLLAAGSSYEETIVLWDVEKGRQVKQMRGHCNAIYALAFLPNGQLVSGSGDGTVRVWDVRAGQWLKAMLILPPCKDGTLSHDWIVFSPKGRWFGSKQAKVFVD